MFNKYVIESIVPGNGVLLYNTMNKAMIHLDRKVRSDSAFRRVNDETYLFLKKNYFFENHKIDDIVAAYRLNNKYSSNVVSLVIHTNYSCNLRCKYCYQSILSDNKAFMNEKTQSKVVKFIYLLVKKFNPQILDICFIGGEPILMQDTIKSLMRRINQVPVKIRKYSVVTNGTLLDISTFLDLERLGVSSFQITLDGDKDIHDCRRYHLDKSGSFDKIMQNLRDLSHIGVQRKIVLNYNLDHQNAEGVRPFLKVLHANKLQYPVIFSLVFDNKNVDTGVTVSGAKTVWLEAHKEAIRWGYRYAPFYRMSYIACGCQKTSSFVISPAGGLYKCISGIEDKNFFIGDIVDYESHKFSMNVSQFVERELPPKCEKCRYLLVCGSGCIYKNIYKGFRCLKEEIEANDIPLVGYQYGHIIEGSCD